MRTLLAFTALVPQFALGAIAIDAHPSLPRQDWNQSSYGGAVSFQSGPFSTTGGGELIIACATIPGVGRTNPSITSTSNLPWTLAKRSGSVSMWVAGANAPLTNERVTITAPAGTGYSDNGLVITALTGASNTVGATASASGFTLGGPTAITTTGTAGSWILDCVYDGATSVPYSGANGTTIGTQLAWQDGMIVYGMGLLRYPTAVSAGTYTVQAGGPYGSYTTAVIEVPAAPTANVPIAAPVAGSYTHALYVALSCTSPSPTIRYTSDGSPPTITSSTYSVPIPITAPGTTTLKAICQSSGYPDSPVGVFAYTLLIAAAPISDPAPGPYVAPQLISLSCATPNSTIYYTTDGSDPTSSSTVYTSPLSIGIPGGTTTVKASCQAPGFGDSAVAAFPYAFECVPFLACDDGNPCTYGDVCDAQEQCVGTPIACVEDQCNARACNGTSTCTVTPKGAASCDDGNPCTYGDTCSSSGICTGTTINCISDACAIRMCNGTSTCTMQPLQAGTSCKVTNDGFPCRDACDGAGQCVVGTPVKRGAPCPFPSACAQVCDGVSPYCQPAE